MRGKKDSYTVNKDKDGIKFLSKNNKNEKTVDL